MSKRTAFRVCGVFLVGYFALLLSQSGCGVATLDAHGIMAAVQSVVTQHELPLSRPPGHPTTELYLFTPIAMLLHVFGINFVDRAYLIAQACGGIAALLAFYALARRFDVKGWRACLALISLAASAYFFANAIDGEEFVFALLFVFLALLPLVRQPPTNRLLLLFSFFAFALATGCRPEIIFAVVIYPVYLISVRADSRAVLFTCVALPAMLLLIWLPFLIGGIHSPLGAGVTLRDAILAATYKLTFQTFGLPVFLLLVLTLILKARQFGDWREAFPRNFAGALTCVMPLLFFALFFRYPTKPAHVLIALPFLLIAAADWPVLLAAITVFTSVDDFVRVDVFRNRQLTRPYLTSGGALRAVREKPCYRFDYLRSLVAQCGSHPTAIIGDVWKWDVEYHISRGTFHATEQEDPNEKLVRFLPSAATNCVILPRDVAFDPPAFSNCRTHGYAIKMDESLFRTAFARYGVMKSAVPDDITLFSLDK